MTSNRRLLTHLPYAHTKDFELIIENVVNEACVDGVSPMYGLLNNITGIVEMRGLTLSLCIVIMQNQQQMLDKAFSGEMNGFVGPDKNVIDVGQKDLF